MANYMANQALNIAANAVTASDVEARLHSGNPGGTGTNNRIGTIAATIAAADWTAAVNGVSETSEDTEFGELNAGAAETVHAYSLWQSGGFLGWADLSDPITVPAGESFALAAGTIEVRFMRP